jgi:hypothetical protein
VEPEPQFTHAAPSAPHSVGSLPGRHCAPEQQPLVHVVVSHTHCPPSAVLSHAAPEPQFAHCAPPAPHSLSFWPLKKMQEMPLQQPLGHRAGVHGVWHWLSIHFLPLGHVWHTSPFVPQASSAVPEEQVCLRVSQQPVGQLPGVQSP